MNALLIGVGATFVGTMYSIYYTRKNLKTVKYIDTITNQRIKWIDTIRAEVSDIVTSIYFTLNHYKNDLKEKELMVRDYENDIESLSQCLLPFEYSITSTAFSTETKIWSQSDFIKKLNLFKLRLNPNEDNEIIGIIDYFIHFYMENEHTHPDIKVGDEKVSILTSKIQILLKNEWEKVKNESKGEIL